MSSITLTGNPVINTASIMARCVECKRVWRAGDSPDSLDELVYGHDCEA